MPDFDSELVSYHTTSPDPVIPCCMNSKLEEDGVVFQHVEPQDGTHLFIGRTSINEAVAKLYNLTPDQVVAKLAGKPKKAEIK